MVITLNRIESTYIKPDPDLSHWCHMAKNLYNEANYIVRQEFIHNGVWIRYYDVWSELKDTSKNYGELPTNTAQQILRLVDKAWKGFFVTIKEWKEHPAKFLGRPKLPHYRPKDGEFVLPFTSDQVRHKDGSIKLPKKIGVEVKTRLEKGTNIRGARIVPQGVGYYLEVIYNREVPEPPVESARIAGLDLGVNNLVTIGTNIGIEPIVVNGGVVKSWNQFYNKKKARLRSVLDRQGQKGSRQLDQLYLKRKRKFRDYFHKTSRMIIDWCVQHDIDTIVIGHNDGWKQNVRLGKRNNQNFVSIPFGMLIGQLEYKAEDVGIRVVLQNEAHTSKCSFLDNEPVCHREEYAGRRIKRGLFRASDGRLINADLQAAYNIVKKAFPNAFADGIEGIGVCPRRLSVA